MLYGRAGEQQVVDRLLAQARDGRSAALVLRGEPGIGKSALLDHAEERAEGFRVIRAAGVESEAELPFAGLGLLLGSAADRLSALPGPQRRALEAAFGLAEQGPGDRLLTGLATLGLLAELATEQPLLCLVDDAHWLDGASAEALLIAARRLRAEAVVLLFAARDDQGAFPAPGLAELPVGPLAPTAAAELLAGRPQAIARRVLAEAHGNPLALIELPAALALEPPGSGPGTVPLTGRLGLAFHGRITRLPAATQTLLLVAAAEESGELDTVLGAAATLGVGPDSLPPAEEQAVLRVTADHRLLFRHPLLRAAVLQRAPLSARLAAHRALAEACPPGDRRTWHQALAATGPDAALADALARTATAAAARGGPAGAAAAFERAARLTPDPALATHRLVLAAESATEAGDLDQAEALATRALARTPAATPLLTGPRATAHFRRGDHPAAYELLLAGARSESVGGDRARLLLQAFHVAWYLGEPELGTVIDELSTLALPSTDPAAPLAEYLSAVTRPLLGRPAPALPPAAEVIDRARRAGAAPRDLVQVCGATLILGRDEETHRLAAELAAEARTTGAVGPLPTLLFFQAEAELFHGRHRDAEVTAAEGLALAMDTGQRQWVSQLRSLQAYVAAIAGEEQTCAELAAAALDAPGPAQAAGHPWAQWALALLDLGHGRAAAALDRLGTLTGGRYRHHVSATRAVPDLVEAAVRLGTPEAAAEAHQRWERWATAADQPWAHALRLRCQALLGPEELAESAYLAALDQHAPTRPFEQARTALLYGEWLRRTRRRTEARTPLRAALETFDRLGAHPWSARTRTELAATGTPTPATPPTGPLATLTPQELQIVRLAAQGLPNRDIAAQLFLSPRTVGHHLYKAYPKLGVAGRGELTGFFDEQSSHPRGSGTARASPGACTR
ncbi:transcriptional regulator [Kitasatospora sp. MMS16-BH015]|uniref:AAA family ATPase n=1 Tax=Kitasatospora sp. MMS16-BH015 TaxID=2018025 RepID=UPI000CA170B3|nr:LuxR family transcriptional regulator [Kitasatospora sp. MMS16-BH015]AUG78306.1 transcriptional regulator [Kitasatospora sp. MMS16-BH015]